MKVLIVNTSELSGGAAVAANRLTRALNNNGVKTRMLVMDKTTDAIWVSEVGGRASHFMKFAYERFVIWTHNLFSRKNLFTVSIADTGYDITKTREFQDADIIHLQWINQGMLSVDGIRKIMESGKPVVWTMHDMWEMTAICHYSYGCTKHETGCHDCHFLRFPHAKDLSYRVFRKKARAFGGRCTYVAVSHWLADQARHSALIGGNPVHVIPNSLSVNKFKMRDKIESRDLLHLSGRKKIVIFGAARIDTPIKGFGYLVDALRVLTERYGYRPDDLQLLLFGGVKDETVLDTIPVPYTYYGRVKGEEQLATMYSAADVVVSSSLYETFGQTLIEAQACGCTPVSFDNSGQADIIEHLTTGYLAKYKSADDLAKGIDWAFGSRLKRENLRSHAVKNFSESAVAARYVQLYSTLTNTEI